MFFKYIKQCLVSLLLIVSNSANAGLIDVADVDEKGYFLDQTSGYLWMDVDNFFGKSYMDIKTDLAGTDFHLATLDELDALFLSAGTEFSSLAPIMGSAFYGEVETIWGFFNQKSDFTDEIELNDYVGDAALSHADEEYVNINGEPWGFQSWAKGHDSQDAASYKGAFVVNSKIAKVPEPSTLAIFALGMIGLASRRFKK